MEYEASPLPEYTLKDEPVTLAMYVFKFGFCEYPEALICAPKSYFPLVSLHSRFWVCSSYSRH